MMDTSMEGSRPLSRRPLPWPGRLCYTAVVVTFSGVAGLARGFSRLTQLADRG